MWEHSARLQLPALPLTLQWPTAVWSRSGGRCFQETGKWENTKRLRITNIACALKLMCADWFIFSCRCARLIIPALMEATTAIRTLAATTWAISQTLCTAVSANLALLEMDSSVERTLILMAGLMLILCVLRTQPITARRLAYIGFICCQNTNHCGYYLYSYTTTLFF